MLSGSVCLYRQEQSKRREAEAAYEVKRQAESTSGEWNRRKLADPTVPEGDKRFIRECLGYYAPNPTSCSSSPNMDVTFGGQVVSPSIHG